MLSAIGGRLYGEPLCMVKEPLDERDGTKVSEELDDEGHQNISLRWGAQNFFRK